MSLNASIPSGTATLRDLARIKDRAELVNERLVILGLLGHLPAQFAGKILIALGDHLESTGRGGAYPSRLGYAIPRLPSGRQSFSPNVSYYDGPLPANPMDIIPGPPTLAVEVRGEADYGVVADDRWAAKRRDYFLAGTLVVWDVGYSGQAGSLLSSGCSRSARLFCRRPERRR